MRDSGSHPSYLYITDLELQCNLIVNEGQLKHINYASQFSQISTLLFISGSCRFYHENNLKLILVDLLNLHVLYIICTESVYTITTLLNFSKWQVHVISTMKSWYAEMII